VTDSVRPMRTRSASASTLPVDAMRVRLLAEGVVVTQAGGACSAASARTAVRVVSTCARSRVTVVRSTIGAVCCAGVAWPGVHAARCSFRCSRSGGDT